MKTIVERIQDLRNSIEENGIKCELNWNLLNDIPEEDANNLLDALDEHLKQAMIWGPVTSVELSNGSLEISFYDHGDYKNQFRHDVTYTPLHEVSNSSWEAFIMEGVTGGLYMDTEDLYGRDE